ncbi:hypothetical protein CU633_20795 [Bacillus sp. V3-13]|uniref:PilW family protein n=1 Tax=Bacillus sp. V3-13 TaxID=2053728 RepID=UPI000C77A745|nr:prepilin-type N-terminal cleavage/methylation domain-containing protein [Bacillus sp. V3-13]PLR75496.1 hypothetical protein CU633_20795 [Bacillus sp. V3-13]
MKISDERGFTLYELLAVLAISFIVLPVIYGVFSSGLKLYNKIQVEGQLRDDADYAATVVMNTFYSFPFDYVKDCGDNCVELVDGTYTQIAKAGSGENIFYSVDQQAKYNDSLPAPENPRVIQLIEKNGRQIIEVNGKEIESAADFAKSSITVSCNEYIDSSENACGKGVISLDLFLDHDRLSTPLNLKSEFGF